MDLKQTIKKVESSKAYKQFIKANPEYYLVHCFSMFQHGDKEHKWELGFYSEKTDKLVVFETMPKVVMRKAEEALKRDGSIKKLDMGKVKVSLTRALEIVSELLAKEYPNRSITKNIIVLQNLERQMYNITLVTISFDIINIKIDADSGDIISHNLQSIMNLGKWEKGGGSGGGVGKPSAA
ncbi:hypothetical protein JXB28_04165 [Candidatus Woesearchaeota archaeon]|nr:hypothetical protein [Candidatus Woesearchaeota archaeon]